MSGAAPLVSVIVPAFNAAATLPEVLDSLTRQTLVEWEAVVVDDGSSDDTVEVAQRRSRDDPRIRMVRQDHGGVSAARNTGIAAAKASRLVFLDADDYLAPDHLARLSEAMPESDFGVACCGFARIAGDGRVIAESGCAEIAEQPFEVFARRCEAAINCFMVSRDLVLAVGGFDTSLATCEDWDLWQRIARTGVRFVGVPAQLAFYRAKPGSLSSNINQLVKDADRVISQARRPDPRVPIPDPRYAKGAGDGDGAEYLTLFAIWCAAREAARDCDASGLLDTIPEIPDLRGDPDSVVTCIYEGLVVGGQLEPADVAAAWMRAHRYMSPLLAWLESASHAGGLAHQICSALERRILADDPLCTPVTLTTWMGVRVDIRRPVAAIAAPQRIDAIDCRICAGDVVLAKVELPTFGTVAAGELAAIIMEEIGGRTVLSQGSMVARWRFWLALLRESTLVAPKLGQAAVLRLVGQRTPMRALARNALRGAVRAALTAVEPPTLGNFHVERITNEERAAVSADKSIHSAPKEAGGDLQVRRQHSQQSDRRAFWEAIFETSDPWHYESSYEQHKYAQTLSLLQGETIDRALELGCAEGMFTKLLAPSVEHLIAADISERALRRARTRCQANQNVDFRQIDFFEDSVPQNLDLIVCSEMLYYAEDRSRLARIAEKLANSLAHGGRLLTAHAFLLSDDPSRTGFDWGHPFGATTICEAFQAAGLTLERSIQTELYRVDLFRKNAIAGVAGLPSIRMEPFGSPLEPQVEAGVVWGGAVVRREDIACAQTLRVPVLLYHRIADEGPAALSDYRVTPRAFEEQMRFLRRHGYHTVSSADLERHRLEQRPMRGRPVLITFDDGYRDFYQRAWPILRRFGFTAEVFLPTDLIGGAADWDRRYGAPACLMSWEEIRIVREQGVRFGSHLATHAPATGLSAEELLREGVRSRTILQRRLDCEITSVAPPFGASDERSLRILELCGFTQIFTTESGPATLDQWSATVPRIEITGRDTIETFAERLDESAAEPGANDALLVTVIVPAFNAAGTIDETLRSVRQQTYPNLEILVVDDGSTDDTALRVEMHAQADPRVRLIRQENAGVAAARNRAVAEAKGDFIAPIDADDLWMPTKIEKQMATMLARGPRCGLVYTWQATIDEKGSVTSTRHRPTAEGYVLPQALFGNFVGSGSPALMRKQAIIEAGGYDSSLRAKRAQGCEDFKLYLQISERYEFAVIKEFLTGYRSLKRAMSMDLLQMQRSHDLVADYAELAHPHYKSLIRDGRTYYQRAQIKRALKHGHFISLFLLSLGLVKRRPWYTLKLSLQFPYLVGRNIARLVRTRLEQDEGGAVPFLTRFSHEIAAGSKAPRLPVSHVSRSELVTSK